MRTKAAILVYSTNLARNPIKSETIAIEPAFSPFRDTLRKSTRESAVNVAPSSRREGIMKLFPAPSRRYSANTLPFVSYKRAPRMCCSVARAPSMSAAAFGSLNTKEAAALAPSVSASAEISLVVLARKLVRSYAARPTHARTSPKTLDERIKTVILRRIDKSRKVMRAPLSLLSNDICGEQQEARTEL